MEYRPPIQVNIPPSQSPARSQSRPLRLKEITTAQALQFTPFTSVTLPVHDRIPIPEITRADQDVRCSTHNERKHVQQFAGQLLDPKVVQQLQTLLRPESLAEMYEYAIVAIVNCTDIVPRKFKHPPSTSRSSSNDPSKQFKPVDLDLSSLAQQLYKMNTLDYTYNPSEPVFAASSSQRPPTSNLRAPPTPAPTVSPENRTQSSTAVPFPQTKSFRQDPSPQKPSVLVPPRQPSPHREAYETTPGSPKRRKIQHDDFDDVQNRSQSQATSAALNDFRSVLAELFEAHQEATISGVSSSNNVFSAGNEDDDDEIGMTLLTNVIERLQTQLKKLSSMHALSHVPMSDLSRLHQLLAPSIRRAQRQNLTLSSEPSSADSNMWRDQIAHGHNGVVASTCSLYIATACPDDESLVTSDSISQIPYVLTNVFDSCIIPVVEARPDSPTKALFENASERKEELKRLLDAGRKLLDFTATACSEVKGCESFVNMVEFLAAKLIFVQNASSDKTSALGTQLYETFRKTAMAVLARLCSRFPQERSAILDEVLSSLDKLPSTSRSARQFRLSDGKNIQLITALFMQLVQTAAMDTKQRDAKTKENTKRPNGVRPAGGDDDSDEDSAAEDFVPVPPFARLQDKVDKLLNPAAKTAQDIVAYVIHRASNTTKTGDSPYRAILDLLIEDLINVLPNCEWPAAEILLRIFANRMIEFAQTEKTASAKNMALESLATMASAISNLRASLPQLIASMNQHYGGHTPDHLTSLQQCATSHVETGNVLPTDLVIANGPFSIVAEFLYASTKGSLARQSASGFFLAMYAKYITATASLDTTDGLKIHQVTEMLLSLLSGSSSCANMYTEEETRLAYTTCLLNLGFCRRLYEMVKALTASLTSEQAQVRSRSLKSVLTLVEADSTLLDRDASIAEDVFKCASDDSALVRDAALSLIARFIVPKPALQHKAIKRLLECAEDSKVGVQKRAISHLKDIYNNDERPGVRQAIARKFVALLGDPEEAIVILAKQTLQDIWFSNLIAELHRDLISAQSNVMIEQLVEHLLACSTTAPDNYPTLMKAFFEYALRKESKTRDVTNEICMRIVDVLFDRIIAENKNSAALLLLTAMCEADAKLIPPPKLSKLKSYLSNIKSEDDLFMLRSAVSIFRNVLPDLPSTYETMLREIQLDLLGSITKFNRRLELDMVLHCLQVIDNVLNNTERLARMTQSLIVQLGKADTPPDRKTRLLRMIGSVGRNIDFSKKPAHFSEQLKASKKSSVSAYLAWSILRAMNATDPVEVKVVALESLGSICQASPAEFNTPMVHKTLFDALKGDASAGTPSPQVRTVVLRVFEELYRVRAQEKDKSDENEKQGLKQMGGDTKTRDQDSAIATITPDVVESVLDIALSAVSEDALLATKTLSSISHQGLVHPKQVLAALVALGTSPDFNIAQVARAAQHLLHEQHESHCEREYMPSITKAFDYQLDIVGDPAGATQPGNAAKLSKCFEIVATSNSKYVKKFMSGLISRTNLNTSDVQNVQVPVRQPLFTRFIVQNIAFADYKKTDELLHVVIQLELAYGKCGSELAAAIESARDANPDIVMTVPSANDHPEFLSEHQTVRTRDPAFVLELKRYGPAAANLMLLVEARAYLIRQYGLAKDTRAALINSKKKDQAKDKTEKAPTKVHGITGDRFWHRSNEIISALDDEEATIKLCEDFVTAINTEEDVELRMDEHDGGEGQDYANYERQTHGKKRKMSASAGGTPTKKPRGRPRKSQSRRSASIDSMEDGDDD